jgi:hypothetical protein
MKKLLPILSLCLVLIPVFTYAQGKTVQIETVTVEQGEPFSLVAVADTNPCLHEARGVVTDELTPLIVAQQKAIEPKSKRGEIRKVKPAPIRWSAPMIRVSPPAREHKPPPLDQWVTIKRPTKRFQLSQGVIKKNIKVYKRTRLPFKPFKVLDPATGRQIAPSTVLTLPDGKKITAQKYYTELNKLERDFNALGYSLDFRRDPAKRVKLQKIVLDPATVTQMNRQKRLLQDTHRFRTLAPPKSIDALQREFRINLNKDRIRLKRLQRFRQPQQIRTSQGTLEQLLLPYAYAAPEDQARPYNKSIETRKYEYGYRDVFAIFFNGGTVLSGDSNKAGVNSVAEAGAYVFNNKLTMLRITGALSAPLASGNMQARLTMTVLGETRLRINQSKPVPLNVDQLPQIPSLALADRSSESLDESFESSFALGPILLSVKFGVRASAGVDYGLFASPANANGRFGPFVASDLYAQAGLNIIIAKAGVSCTLVLLDNCLTLSGQLKVDADQRGPYFSAVFSIYDRFEALSGEVSLYACILVPKFALPPWGYKCWDWEIAKWEGLQAKGYIVKQSSERSYFFEEGPPEPGPPPPPGGEDFGVEGEIAGRWLPAGGSLSVSKSESLFGPAPAVFNDRLYLVHRSGIKISYRSLTLKTLQDQSPGPKIWPKENIIPGNTLTTIPPAVCIYKNRLYVFHGGWRWPDQGIYYRYMDQNGNWWPQAGSVKVEGSSTAYRPALTVFNNRLYLVHKRPGKDGIYYRYVNRSVRNPSGDGSELLAWTSMAIRETKIPGKTKTATGPAVCAFKGKLYIFHRGKDSSDIYYRCMGPDGSLWPRDGDTKVAKSQTSNAPALAVLKDRLFMVHKEKGTRTTVYCRIADCRAGAYRLVWSEPEKIRGITFTDHIPGVCVFKDQFHMFHKGRKDDKKIYYRWYEEQQ